MGRTVVNRAGLDKLRVAADELTGTRTKVGFFETAKYADGTPVASVAVVQEFGSQKNNIPPRSFMRSTMDEQSKTWAHHMQRGAAAVARGALTAGQVMDSIGALAAGDVRKKIAEIQAPPLAESTVKARQRRYADKGTTGNLRKPLVDTAVMVNAVTHVVETGENFE